MTRIRLWLVMVDGNDVWSSWIHSLSELPELLASFEPASWEIQFL